MPRTGGLLSSARRSAAPSTTASSNRDRGNQASADLPPYEPPSCPLTEGAIRALSELTTTRTVSRTYDKNLTESAKHLATSIGQINERAVRRRLVVEAAAERRQKKGQEKSAQDEKNEAALSVLEAQVPRLTTALEEGIRQVIDSRAALEDEKDVYKEVSRQVAERPAPAPRNTAQQRKRRRGRQDAGDSEDGGQGDADSDVEMNGGEEEEQANIPATLDLLEEVRTAKKSKYDNLSVVERYGKNNDYILFKRTWHDALHPDDDIPLPDPSQWFDEDGNPVVNAEGANEEEDELMVAREVLSFKCPLSLRVMEEPYSSKKCKHSFEKEAILEFLRPGPKNCPETGCNVQLYTKDMFFDEYLLRKIKRAANAAREDAMDATSDVEPDEIDDEESDVRVVPRKAKKEPKNEGSSSRGGDEDDIEDEVV